jgi:hypothetical protein
MILLIMISLSILLYSSFDPLRNLPFMKENSGNKGGRSDAFFFITYDRRFIVKTVTFSEQKNLVKNILSAYHEHIYGFSESLLARIYGCFTVCCEGSIYRLIIMKNIFPTHQNSFSIFDLKGSTAGRRELFQESINSLSGLQQGKVYKDLDFVQVKQSIYLPYEDQLRLKRTLQKDVELLTTLNIVDYSLLTGVFKEGTFSHPGKHFRGIERDEGLVFVLGIIDFLQHYTTFKRLETFFKTLGKRKKDEISVINPRAYGGRFMRFVSSILNAGIESPSVISIF